MKKLLTLLLILPLFVACSKDDKEGYSVMAQPTEGGSVVSGVGKYYEDQECILIAKSNKGFGFAGWYIDEDKLLSKDEVFRFKVTHNLKIKAIFSNKLVSIHVATILPNGYETTDQRLNVPRNELISLEATANSLAFMGWYDNETKISSEYHIQYKAIENTTLFKKYQ